MSVRVFDRPADVLAAVGARVGPGEWVELTQDRVDTFARATGDHQWIHVDPVRAATGPFGATIAHGYLTLSLVPMLAAGVVTWGGCRARVNYGADRVRFPQPVRVGSRVRARGEIVAAAEGGSGVRVTMRWTVEIEDEPRPACVADTIALLVP